MITIEEIMVTLMIVLPFWGSVIIGFFRSTAQNNEAWFAGAIALFCFFLTLMLYPFIINGKILQLDISYLPRWGLVFSLRLDGLSWLFLLLITGIGFLVTLYSRYYMNPMDPVPRFFSFLLAFMGSMSGIVLSGNLIFLVIFWEMTSILSFLLIGYWYQNAGARDAARTSLTITGSGGFALFLGIILIGQNVGSYDIDIVLDSGELLRSDPLFPLILFCIFCGALTKSAQFPFHFWLPGAMAAPTPASVYLHSATMVKAGIFLLARLWPVMSQTELWFWILCPIGLTTLLLGAFFAIFQQDIKGLLAYSTMSHLGLMIVLLSLGSPIACVAAIFHMVNHATFKASLFMAAGIIDHETGTRDMRKLSGLFRSMPYTTALAVIATAAMAGVPLLNGFLSKEMFFAQAVEVHIESLLDKMIPYIATLASLFSVVYSVRFIHCVFLGPVSLDLLKTPREPPRFMRLPVELLVFLCLLVGIVPNWSIAPILSVAVHAVLSKNLPTYNLTLWHGFSTPFAMSLIAFLGGILFYTITRHFLSKNNGQVPFFFHFKGQYIFERVILIVSLHWARHAEKILSTNRLQVQVRWVFITIFFFVFFAIYSGILSIKDKTSLPVDPVFVLLWLIGCICAVTAAWKAKFHRFAALILLGGTGLVTCINFLWLSAPDLALTQLLVEIVSTVLLLLGLRWLPKRWQDPDPLPSGWIAWLRRFFDFILAVLGGIALACGAWLVMTRQQQETVAEYFIKNSYEKAGGYNIVNVTIVDFRGFDTMGEITVLAIVSLGVYALLRRFRPAPESIEPPSQQKIQSAFDTIHPEYEKGNNLHNYFIIPSLIIHWLFPVIITFSFYLFIHGHDLPGGGFAAGITLAIAFILQYLASGTRWVENHLVILPLRWVGAGLVISLFTGFGALLAGYSFLTSFFSYVNVPFIGAIPVASALFFDLGVFVLVVGATVLILVAIAHQSIRRYRIRYGSMPSKGEER